MKLQPERGAGLLALPVVLLLMMLMAAACGVIGGDGNADGNGIRETRAAPTPDLPATIAVAVQQAITQTQAAPTPADTPPTDTPSAASRPAAPAVDLQATIAAAIARAGPTPPPTVDLRATIVAAIGRDGATPAPPGAPTYVPASRPTPTSRPTPVPTATPALLGNCPDADSGALRYAGPDAAAAIRALPWVADGVAGTECAAVRELGYLADYPAVFRIYIARPWVADGVSQLERAVIDRTEDIAGHDAALAERLANLPWLAWTEAPPAVAICSRP